MKTVDEAYKVLFETKKIMDDLGIEFWLDGGTLLGFVRDGCFPKDDHDDIDISCWRTDNVSVLCQQLTERFKKAHSIIYNHWNWNDKAHELSVVKYGIKVDIFFKERKMMIYNIKERVR